MRISRTRGEVLYYCTATGERRWSAPPMPQQGAVLLSDAVSLPSRTVSPVLKGQALQSPASHMMSPSSHMVCVESLLLDMPLSVGILLDRCFCSGDSDESQMDTHLKLTHERSTVAGKIDVHIRSGRRRQYVAIRRCISGEPDVTGHSIDPDHNSRQRRHVGDFCDQNPRV
jgi:hypothetical protein